MLTKSLIDKCVSIALEGSILEYSKEFSPEVPDRSLSVMTNTYLFPTRQVVLLNFLILEQDSGDSYKNPRRYRGIIFEKSLLN